MKLIKRALYPSLWSICIACLLTLATLTLPAVAETVSAAAPPTEALDASALFDLHCAGCHANGGNIIRRGKNLKRRAMIRNGYEDVEAIGQIIRQGKGAMTAFADRLREEEVSAIAGYVHQKAETGW